MLGWEVDHIVPWRSSYCTKDLVGGEVLPAEPGGHIAGLVNPPGGKKATFWAGANDRAEPDGWRAGAEERAGSWWEDWADWAAERLGEQVAPPELPEGDPAPGRYVLEQRNTVLLSREAHLGSGVPTFATDCY